jgi:hypothetical protein
MINHRSEYNDAPGLQLVQTSLLSQVYAVLAKVNLHQDSLISVLIA